MKVSRDRVLLGRIAEAIVAIEGYASGRSLKDFMSDRKTFDAVLMQFVIIGESANNISDEFKDQHPRMPWYEAVGLRNEVTHGYFRIRPEVIWKTIENDLPKLKAAIKKVLE